jgi:hypothetical protein
MNKSNFLELNLPSRDNTTDIADINAISDNFEIIDGVFLDLVEKEIPKLQTKENMNLNFDDDSTYEEQYPSVPAVVNFTNRKVNPLKIVNSASGNAIAIKDSAKDKLVNLKLYGATTQDGTPTPTNPKELKSVGDSGSFEVGVYGRSLLEVNNTTQTKGGVTFTVNADKSITVKGTATYELTYDFCSPQKIKLPIGKYKMLGKFWVRIYKGDTTIATHYCEGISPTIFEITESGLELLPHYWCGNGTTIDTTTYPMILLADETDTTFEKGVTPQALTFTDTLRGVGDIKDEVDFARGVKIQRYEKISLAIADMNNYDSYPGWYGAVNLNLYFNYNETPATKAISNISNGNCLGFSKSGNVLWLPVSTFGLTQTQWKEQYPNLVVEFLLPLLTPIETPLTETELNAYRQLHTNKPTTTILSEAEMLVDYVADPKNYIDNKIAELTALTLEG